ncbi:MAG: AI-2E family transporter [Spirochaetota bacterium]
MADQKSGTNRAFILVLLAAVLGLVLLVLWRFLTPIILSILLALLVMPVYGWLLKLLGGRRNLAALLTVLGVFLTILIPASGFMLLLFTQGASLLRDLSDRLDEGMETSLLEFPMLERLQSLIETRLPDASNDGASLSEQLSGVADSAVQFLVSNGVTIFGNIADVVAKFFILLFLLFYLVRDGASMVARLRDLLPLRDEQTSKIFDKVRDVTRAVVFGTLAVAALQGLLGGIGFRIVGLPGLVWGTVIGVSSLIPVVGTGLVTIPAVAYLFFNELYWQSAFFTIWAAVLVGGVDNYLRPFFMRGQARMSPFYIFLAIIGGLATFGLSGLVFGPLIIAIAIVVVEIYREEYRPASMDRAHGTGSARPVRQRSSPASWHVRRLLRRSRRR